MNVKGAPSKTLPWSRMFRPCSRRPSAEDAHAHETEKKMARTRVGLKGHYQVPSYVSIEPGGRVSMIDLGSERARGFKAALVMAACLAPH